MSEPLPPIREPVEDGSGTMSLRWYRYFEGVDRFIGTPPEEGSTGTAANYDVGTSGGRVPVLDGGTASQPNTWGGYNVFTGYIGSQVGYRVKGIVVVNEQQAAIADASPGVAAVGAPTQAEFNALVTQFNALVTQFNLSLASDRTHGLIAT